MKKDFSPKSRKDKLVIQELDGEVLIYDLENEKALCLNVTSALVWQACDGSRSVADINSLVSKKLNSTINDNLVWLALDQLKKEKLIENGKDVPSPFAGMSRREVLKKVGMGSMVALPIIAGLVAPMAIHAASSCVLGLLCRCPAPTPNGTTCAPSTMACLTNCNCVSDGTPQMGGSEMGGNCVV